jgi:capsular polysaccharide transport system permease protein
MTLSSAYSDTPSDVPGPNSRMGAGDGMTTQNMEKQPYSSESESMVERRRRLHVEAKRHRLRVRLGTLGLIIAPVLLGVIYLLFLASPQYAAESRFTVQATQATGSSSGSGTGVSSLLSTGGGLGSALSGFVDGWAVQDFLNSRDCMRQLDKKIGLRSYLSKRKYDFLNYLSPNANEDALFKSYKKMVHNSYNMIEQINVVDVDGFSPSDSTRISDGLMSVVQDFVNRMNALGLEDALKVSRDSLQQAEDRDRNALAALAEWRAQHGNIDPTADASMLLSQVGLIESSLSAAQVNLDKVNSLQNPNHPMLKPAQAQVDALTDRLNQLRARMTGQGGVNTSAALLKTYTQLTNEQVFADSFLLTARQNYQQATTNALALQRYLAIIARPVAESRPSLPNPFVLLLITFALGCALAGGMNLTLSLYRSLRHV